jgi:hypothetical protein
MASPLISIDSSKGNFMELSSNPTHPLTGPADTPAATELPRGVADRELAPAWPVGSEMLELAYVTSPSDANFAAPLWLDLQEAANVTIRLVRAGEPPHPAAMADATTGLVVVTVPGLPEEHAAWLHSLQQRLDNPAAAPRRSDESLLLTLHGALVLWQPRRVIIVAPPDRLPAVAKAVVEASFYEAELRSLEGSIDRGWPQLESDGKLAFEIRERDRSQRAGLGERFQKVLGLRARYARLMPHILVPYVFPPTLASQIGERFRERKRMAERLELVDQKLAAQEHVYELCSHRHSEFMLARTGHQLEWIIIILLLVQCVLLIIEYLSSQSS